MPERARSTTRLYAAVGLIIAMAASGQQTAVAQDPPPASSRSRVVVLGDDAVVAASDALHGALDADYQVGTEGVSGARVAQLLDRADAFAAFAPDQVVIDAGGNDLRAGRDPNDVAADVRQLVERFAGARCVHVATVNERTSDVAYQLRAGLLNGSLRALALVHPNVRTLDIAAVEFFESYAGSPRGPVTAGPSLTPLGSRYFAESAKAVLDSCAAPASVRAVVFHDMNGNGKRDADEQPMDGVGVNLIPDYGKPPIHEPAHDVMLTADGGRIERDRLPAGEYVLQAEGAQWRDYSSSVYTTTAFFPLTLTPGQQVAVEIGYRPSGPKVVLLGDSIFGGADAELRAALPAHQVSISARPARRIAELQWWADEYAAKRPTQVVIDLGTNDAQQHWDMPTSVADLHRLIETFDDAQCVHVTTITTHNPKYRHEAEVLNHEIRMLPSSHPNVRVVDWDHLLGAFSSTPGALDALMPDGTHPSGVGNQFLAAAVAEWVGLCDLASMPA